MESSLLFVVNKKDITIKKLFLFRLNPLNFPFRQYIASSLTVARCSLSPEKLVIQLHGRWLGQRE